MPISDLASNDVLDATSQWVVVYSPDMRIQHANRAALQILGRRAEDVVGRSWQELGLPERVMGPLEDQARTTFEDGVPRSGTLELHLPEETRWLDYHLERVETPGGARFVVSSKIETTQVRRMARDMEEFASVVAHDFKGPLITMSYRAEHALEEMERGTFDADEVRAHLGAIERSAARLHDLADILLEHARAGHIQPELGPHDPRESLEEASAVLGPRLVHTGAEVQVDIDKKHRVTADPELLTQVWQNLLQNSVRYRGDDPPRIEVSSRIEGDHVALIVQDHGLGIPTDRREELFKPFQTLGRDSGGGSGIGLAFSRRVVEAQHGTLEEEPSDDGARFVIRLPRADR